MRKFLLIRVAPVVAAATAIWMCVLVLYGRPTQRLQMRLPGADTAVAPDGGGDVRPLPYNALDRSVCKLRLMDGKPAGDIPGLWPQYRGPNRDNISPETTPLLKSWPAGGPKALWSVELGEGYAAPAVRNGRVYVLDYDPPDRWFLNADDIADYKALSGWVRNRDKAPPGKSELLALLSPGEGDIRTVITAGTDEASRLALLARFNAILDMPDLYRRFNLAEMPLPPEARRYLVEQASPDGQKSYSLRATISTPEVLRLNRILLESVLSGIIVKSNHADVMRCLSLADGKDIWRLSYPVKTTPDHGVTRTVPAVTDKYVVSLGPKCLVVCLDAASGNFVWGIDMVRAYKTQTPLWYAGQCPLIDGDRVIIAPGGSSLMAAVELETGKVIWETPNPRKWKMTHSSISIQELAGRKIYVYCAGNNVSGGVVGVDAQSGAVLWETDLWKISTTIPSPLCLSDGRVFLSGGYGAGCTMIRVMESGGVFSVGQLWHLPAEDYGSVQQTPIFWQGFIYGTRPDGQLACLDLDGQVKWTSGPTVRFGGAMGPYLIADGLIYLMNDTGTLTLAAVNPDGYRQLAQARVLGGHDSWGPMAIAGGRLLVRDFTRMVCLDVREEPKP